MLMNIHGSFIVDINLLHFMHKISQFFSGSLDSPVGKSLECKTKWRIKISPTLGRSGGGVTATAVTTDCA
jgi:hypothetical protein